MAYIQGEGRLQGTLFPMMLEDLVAADSMCRVPAIKAAGLPENHQVTGVGGSANIDSVSIPSLTLTVGGRPVALKPAHLLLHDNNSTSNRFSGNLGMDLLNQARSVEIDFQSMTLALH